MGLFAQGMETAARHAVKRGVTAEAYARKLNSSRGSKGNANPDRLAKNYGFKREEKRRPTGAAHRQLNPVGSNARQQMMGV